MYKPAGSLAIFSVAAGPFTLAVCTLLPLLLRSEIIPGRVMLFIFSTSRAGLGEIEIDASCLIFTVMI
jgi:hypothetical protein